MIKFYIDIRVVLTLVFAHIPHPLRALPFQGIHPSFRSLLSLDFSPSPFFKAGFLAVEWRSSKPQVRSR